MMTLWDPMRDMLSLREAVNRLFEDSVVRPGALSYGLPVDIVESDNELILSAYCPGCSKDSFDINYQNEVLTIKVRRPEEKLPEGSRHLLREWSAGELTRSFRLPLPVDIDQVKAVYRDGVLRLNLPKAESVRPRQIQVK